MPGGLDLKGNPILKDISVKINGQDVSKYYSVSQSDTSSGQMERYYLALFRTLGVYYRNSGKRPFKYGKLLFISLIQFLRFCTALFGAW